MKRKRSHGANGVGCLLAFLCGAGFAVYLACTAYGWKYVAYTLFAFVAPALLILALCAVVMVFAGLLNKAPPALPAGQVLDAQAGENHASVAFGVHATTPALSRPAVPEPTAAPAPHTLSPVQALIDNYVERLTHDGEATQLAKGFGDDAITAFVLRDKLLDLGCSDALTPRVIRAFIDRHHERRSRTTEQGGAGQ